jgi:hypothetical protein
VNMEREAWKKAAELSGSSPLSQDELDAIWREWFDDVRSTDWNVGDFGDFPLEWVFLTFEQLQEERDRLGEGLEEVVLNGADCDDACEEIALKALGRWVEPCEHGFQPPSSCPNEVCETRTVALSSLSESSISQIDQN